MKKLAILSALLTSAILFSSCSLKRNTQSPQRDVSSVKDEESVDDVFEKDPGYFGWIQNADFPLYTKKVLIGLKLKRLNTKS